MKKTLLSIIFFVAIAYSAVSQDLATTSVTDANGKFLSKRGLVIQPEAGDLGIGISANPFFNYLGNFFSQDGNSFTPTFTALNPGEINLRYFMDEQTAVRASLRLGLNSSSQNLSTNPDIKRKFITSAATIGISAGLEKSKSLRGRIRGYYGAQVVLDKTPYSGLDTNGDFVVGRVSYTDSDNEAAEYVEKGGGTFSVGVGAFVGIEYFFAPKISLNGEFGLGIDYSKTGKRKYKRTNQDEIINSTGGSFVGLSTSASGGSLSLNIYF